MKKYCLDTSGLSYAMQVMPEDIHETLWKRIRALIETGCLAVTAEIYKELTHIEGLTGDCIKANASALLLEVDDDSWDNLGYIGHAKKLQNDHAAFISEFNKNIKGTVGLTDISIIALGRTLAKPVISMESSTSLESPKRRRIPDICLTENIPHMTFNDMCRAEGIKA